MEEGTVTPQNTQANTGTVDQSDSKSFLVTAMLSFFLGGLGIDRFYLGKIGTGVLKLITSGGFLIWALVDLILILTGNMKDKAGRPLQGREENLKTALLIIGVVILLQVLFFIMISAVGLSLL